MLFGLIVGVLEWSRIFKRIMKGSGCQALLPRDPTGRTKIFERLMKKAFWSTDDHGSPETTSGERVYVFLALPMNIDPCLVIHTSMN